MLSPFRLSVCRLSVTFVHLTQPVDIFGNFSSHLVSWPSVDIHGKFYRDRPRGTPPSGGLNARGVSKIAIFDIWNAASPTQCKIGGKLVLITNKKSYMSFRLIPKSVTLNDLERRNGSYFALFHRIVYDVVVKQLLGLPRFQNLLLIVYDHISTTICAISQPLFRQNKLW